MKRVWAAAAIIVVLVAELTILGQFATAQTGGLIGPPADLTSQGGWIVIAKAKYVYAKVDIDLTPNYGPVTLLLTDGRSLNITKKTSVEVVYGSVSSVPFFGNFIESGAGYYVSNQQPLSLQVLPQVVYGPSLVPFQRSSSDVDIYFIAVVGYATVAVSAIGVSV